MSSCIYCGLKVRAGGTCQKSPHKRHEVAKPDHCRFCGQKVRVGGTCQKSPTKRHMH